MKRALTKKEIEYVLSDVKPIMGLEKHVALRIHEKITNGIREDLQKASIYPEKIDALKDAITKHYYSTQISPGVSVGIATSQSIGERQTQLALNSFHSTGMTTMTVVTGVPRFNELVNATKNPKSVISTIYFQRTPKTIQEARKHISMIKHVRFEQVVKSYSTSRAIKDEWYVCFKYMYPEKYADVRNCNCFVRFHCNLQVLYESRLLLLDVVTRIEESYEGVVCAWSPDELGIVDVWFNTHELKVNTENPSITKENKVYMFVEEILIPTLYPLSLKGVDGIEEVDFSQTPDKTEWYVDAMGYNLHKLFTLSMVDETRTVSNHMWEILSVLGIEAVREFLIQEFIAVISTESFINLRHIQLLVDVMLFTGDISSISRYGMHKNQSGALTKCSFEESLDQILKAGIHGENEKINGVSGAIITGKLSNIGTGLCDLLYDIPE